MAPAEGILSTTDELYDAFVRSFATSQTRERLFQEWMNYNRMLRQELGIGYVQWVDGSFVTQKLNPKDIDIVSFIPFNLYDVHKTVLDNFWSDIWEKEGIDAYIVKVYPIDQPSYRKNTLLYYDEWFERYTKTKPDQRLNQFDKGFLIINV